ncbi:RadC-like protein [Ectopseudomonas mendocina NK-01]|nr:RadC-like protein [Pseudomonas mendocina NK-01]
MSQLSLAFDTSLMIRDEQGRYLPATAEQILDAARKVIDKKVQRGAAFKSSELVKDYLIAKLGGFEHEVFSALFLDAKHNLIQYVEMFRGTIDSASVYPREMVKRRKRAKYWSSPCQACALKEQCTPSPQRRGEPLGA